MARHGRQERANEWGAPMTNRGAALVRDMTVLLFGNPGAVSIEMYKARKAGGST